MTMTPVEVLDRCLSEADGDVTAGLAAAEYILSNRLDVVFSTDDKSNEATPPLSAFLAHDIHNRHAQGILNRSLRAARGLSAAARADLAKALERGVSDSGQAILEFINKYRLQLAKLLTTTQLASLLEGAREVAAKVPVLDSDAEAVRESVGDIPLPTFPVQDDIHFPTIDGAAKELAGKNVLSRQGYDSLDAAARAKAFAVAGVDAEETLTKIRDVLAENVREGADYATFKQKVLDAVDEGTFLSDSHQEVVFRTNIQSAFSDGQMTVLSHPLVRSGFPYAVYDAIHDDRVRHNHLALEKLGIGGTNVYRIDDPVFQMFRPPWDYQDRCSWTPITVRQASERGVPEATTWLDTGVEPSPPAHVPMPAFAPPPGFQRAVASAPMSIRLSMQPMVAFSVAWDESKHPRGQPENAGEFGPGGGGSGQKVAPPAHPTQKNTVPPRSKRELSARAKHYADTFRQQVMRQKQLSEPQKVNYAASIDYVMSRLPDAAIQRMAQHTKNVGWHANPNSIKAAVIANLEKLANGPARNAMLTRMKSPEYRGVVGGVYLSSEQTLHLDGDHGWETDAIGKSRSSTHETYAHELGHTIDGPKFEYSRSVEWGEAWSTEIGNHKALGANGGHTLSAYATTQPAEGLAEFARLLYGNEIPTAIVKQRFPKCVAFFESKGLIPT